LSYTRPGVVHATHAVIIACCCCVQTVAVHRSLTVRHQVAVSSAPLPSTPPPRRHRCPSVNDERQAPRAGRHVPRLGGRRRSGRRSERWRRTAPRLPVQAAADRSHLQPVGYLLCRRCRSGVHSVRRFRLVRLLLSPGKCSHHRISIWLRRS